MVFQKKATIWLTDERFQPVVRNELILAETIERFGIVIFNYELLFSKTGKENLIIHLHLVKVFIFL